MLGEKNRARYLQGQVRIERRGLTGIVSPINLWNCRRTLYVHEIATFPWSLASTLTPSGSPR